ncbi:MAG: hypothetical protein ABFS17_00485 [Chloroflexota bacterium]
MTISNQYPNLQIVPLDKVHLHENHDPQRTAPLIERLTSEGILLNPPIISYFQNGDEEYMVLDGANRVTSFREMGIPHILAQIVEPDSPSLRLQTWNHVIWGIEQEKFLELVAEIDGIEARPYSGELLNFTENTLALMQMPNLGLFKLVVSDAAERIAMLNQIVDAYKSVARYDRTHIEEIRKIINLYSDLAALVVYPNFTIEEILETCRLNNLLPAGVTRFLVSPRALRIKYPLERLTSKQSLEEKNQDLQAFIQQRLEIKGVRIYTETTAIYDE